MSDNDERSAKGRLRATPPPGYMCLNSDETRANIEQMGNKSQAVTVASPHQRISRKRLAPAEGQEMLKLIQAAA